MSVPAFTAALDTVVGRVPETLLVMVMGTDGIPIERRVVHAEPNLDAVAAEYTALLRASVSAAEDTGLGDLRELCIVTDRLTAILVGITSEYFLFAALSPGGFPGRARFVLRLVGLSLQKEFQ